MHVFQQAISPISVCALPRIAMDRSAQDINEHFMGVKDKGLYYRDLVSLTGGDEL